eukprot:PhM_4_TR18455/c0_g1_i1/m.17641
MTTVEHQPNHEATHQSEEHNSVVAANDNTPKIITYNLRTLSFKSSPRNNANPKDPFSNIAANGKADDVRPLFVQRPVGDQAAAASDDLLNSMTDSSTSTSDSVTQRSPSARVEAEMEEDAVFGSVMQHFDNLQKSFDEPFPYYNVNRAAEDAVVVPTPAKGPAMSTTAAPVDIELVEESAPRVRSSHALHHQAASGAESVPRMSVDHSVLEVDDDGMVLTRVQSEYVKEWSTKQQQKTEEEDTENDNAAVEKTAAEPEDVVDDAGTPHALHSTLVEDPPEIDSTMRGVGVPSAAVLELEDDDQRAVNQKKSTADVPREAQEEPTPVRQIEHTEVSEPISTSATAPEVNTAAVVVQSETVPMKALPQADAYPSPEENTNNNGGLPTNVIVLEEVLQGPTMVDRNAVQGQQGDVEEQNQVAVDTAADVETAEQPSFLFRFYGPGFLGRQPLVVWVLSSVILICVIILIAVPAAVA